MMKFIGLLLFFLPKFLLCQNLVPNPGFELNRELSKNQGRSVSDDFKFVDGWKLLGWQSYYCHCKTVTPINWYLSACRKHLYQPRSGCGMVKMVYEESSLTDPDLNSTVEYFGATSYLECKLTSPLELGEVYEISFWVYFPKDSFVEKSILTHIGFIPSLHYISMSPQNMLHMDRFFGDSIPMGEWFQIKKFIRALCPLEYLVIGAFRNSSFPLIHRWHDFGYPSYYIDDVNVEKITGDSFPSHIVPTPFCKFFEEEELRLEVPTEKTITLNFEQDSSTLSGLQQIRLDSFIEAVESRWQPVYSIVGHTDNTGNENNQLSFDRATKTKENILVKHDISEFRFACFAAADTRPLGNNNTSEGRQNNRRVEIRVTSLSKPMGLYRRGLESLQNNDLNESIAIFRKWVSLAKYYEIIYLLFDYRIDALKKTPRWKSIQDEIKTRYRKSYSSEHTYFLDSLRCEDQRYRTLERWILGLSGFFKDYETFDFEYYSCNDQELQSLDSNILRSLLEYLDAYGFPKIAEIGRRNVEGIINIIIHSDTAVIEKYLPVIERRCLEGEAQWDSYVMMADRNLRLKGLPQLFGTQFEFLDKEKTKLIMAPIDDLSQVNTRRVKLGLYPIPEEKVTSIINFHRTGTEE